MREENRNETSQKWCAYSSSEPPATRWAKHEIMFSLSNPANVGSAFDQVLDAFPALRRFGRSLLFAVNEEYAVPEREVFAGDELAVFPSVSGGLGADAEIGGTGETWRRGNTGDGGRGDTETRRRGDTETRRDIRRSAFRCLNGRHDTGRQKWVDFF